VLSWVAGKLFHHVLNSHIHDPDHQIFHRDDDLQYSAAERSNRNNPCDARSKEKHERSFATLAL